MDREAIEQQKKEMAEHFGIVDEGDIVSDADLAGKGAVPWQEPSTSSWNTEKNWWDR